MPEESKASELYINPVKLGAASYALEEILSEIDRIGQPAENNEDTPTAHACSTARLLLREAHQIGSLIQATTVESSEGDLLIHWDVRAKSVVLICPKDDRAPSIYREVLDGNKATSSELTNNVSATSLSDAISWVIQP
jgi:hypothetical protein